MLNTNVVTPIIPRRGVNDEGRGKKYALRKLIGEAQTEYVHLMDDDIVPPAALPDTDADMVILPLRMEADHPRPNLIERLQIAEYAAIQQLTILTAQKGHTVMCSGANLLVRRKRWMESYEDLHSEIASGADMFLLESFKRRGLRIAVADEPAYTATVRPLPTLRTLLKQRMRWAGKSAHYRDKDIIICGFIVAVANIMQVIFPPLLLIKFPIEYHLIRQREQQDTGNPRSAWWVILLLELLYPFYMLICLLGGGLQKRKTTY